MASDIDYTGLKQKSISLTRIHIKNKSSALKPVKEKGRESNYKNTGGSQIRC